MSCHASSSLSSSPGPVLPATNTSYQIICKKTGNGIPFLISDDTNPLSQWTKGSGFAANKNPKIGSLFGRLYAANSFSNNNSGKIMGIYAMNADQSLITVAGPTNIPGTANIWGGGSFSSNTASCGLPTCG